MGFFSSFSSNIGDAQFVSATYRLFKVPESCKTEASRVTYKGKESIERARMSKPWLDKGMKQRRKFQLALCYKSIVLSITILIVSSLSNIKCLEVFKIRLNFKIKETTGFEMVTH